MGWQAVGRAYARGCHPSPRRTRIESESKRERSMSFERISDESVARYYESIRQQADEDRRHKYHFTASPNVREWADKLRQEMIKRRLQHSPINWPSQ